MVKKMRLFLIGMPGCGKSTLGKCLAEKLGYEYIDMDNYIEKEACMFVDEIFEAYGEDFFRALEKNALKDFDTMDNVVIATGGGVIKDKSNKKLMNGKCIYLYADIDSIKNRLLSSEVVRPLLQTKTVEELYNERKELYEYFKDIKVDNYNIDAAVKEIMEALK
ncbi:MAG: shikimate kinase [Erysipelotrichaceae bacterium]|nr:shikimate kinase [Erysipelotrichaceae bacterium]